MSNSTSNRNSLTASLRNLFIRPKQTPIPEQDGTKPRSNSMELIRPSTATVPEEFVPPRFLNEQEMKAEVIGGREYIPESTYIFATDDEDAQRLTWQHFFLKDFFGSNVLAPVKPDKIKAVLEIGYGSGIWALEMAREQPHVHVYAVDIRNNHVPQHLIPSNVLFQRADISQGLPFMSRSFDYIHQRLCGLAGNYETFGKVFQDYYRMLRPGGLVEVLEISGVYHNAGPLSVKYLGLLNRMAAARGIDNAKIENMDKLLKKAGFRQVKKNSTHLISLGSYAGKHGENFYQMVSKVIRGALPFAEKMGMATVADMEAGFDAWEAECNEKKTYMQFHLFTAMKPN